MRDIELCFRYYNCKFCPKNMECEIMLEEQSNKAIKIEIPFAPPSINNYIGRTNIWNYQKEKKKFQRDAKMLSFNLRPKEPIKKCKIDITYQFADRKLRDTNNYDKFVFDFLVDSKFIEDDNLFVIEETITRGIIGKETKIIINIIKT